MKVRDGLLILTLLILHATAIAQTTDRSRYVGYAYDGSLPDETLSNGVTYRGGGLVGDINADPVYGISQLEKGKKKMLWLEVSTGKTEAGVTGWKVIDVLSFPALAKNDEVFLPGLPEIMCRRNGAELENVVGVGKIDRRRGTFKPTRLWIANLETRRFEAMSITRVKCEYSEP